MTPKSESVFLNVPFDRHYTKLFQALVYTVHECGFIARCALDGDDGSQTRFEKLLELIHECPLGIHDLSRTTLDRTNRLPRFNMPLELGVFLGAKYYGGEEQGLKSCLILERDRHRYQKFCSDIAGQDIRAHHNRISDAIAATRNWLQAARQGRHFPTAGTIERHYLRFRPDLEKMCRRLGDRVGSLTFIDYRTYLTGWIEENVA